ncbi:MAG: SPFH domain-containing protein [bacterium]|nr:SPFH domain-containing protein [bacterium]
MRIWLILLIVIVLAIIVTGAYIVQQQTNVIIERLGKFHKVVGPGFHIKIPVIDRIVSRVNMRTSQSTFDINAKTQDNVTVQMDIAAQYHVNGDHVTDITDSGVYRSYYMLQDPIAQMRSYLIDALRSAIPNYTLDEVFAKKDDIASEVNQTVSDMMRVYGFDVVSTLITNIGLPPDVEASMNKINSAQREQVAAQALAEAERIKVVTVAKANAEAMEQAGIGIAAQRRAIADGIAKSIDVIRQSGVATDEANELFLFTQWTDMMESFAKNGKQSTIVLPSNFSETASMFEQMLVAQQTDESNKH